MTTRRAQPVLDPEAEAAPTKTKAPKATKTATEKAPREPKAPKEKAPKPAPELDADGNPVARRRQVRGDRNHLARSIDQILRAASGPVSVKDIVSGITYEDGSHPSSGAVSAALKRWAEQGYITVTPKPLGFKAFPANHKKGSLDTFLTKSRDDRLSARRAARAAA